MKRYSVTVNGKTYTVDVEEQTKRSRAVPITYVEDEEETAAEVPQVETAAEAAEVSVEEESSAAAQD